MRQLQKFSTWYPKFLLGMVPGAALTAVLFGNLLASVPLHRLLWPWLVYSAALAAFGALMYLSLQRATKTGARWLVFVTTAVGTVPLCCLLFSYASQFQLISWGDFRALCVTSVVTVPAVTLLLYYADRRWLHFL
jgi:hypothetical protein